MIAEVLRLTLYDTLRALGAWRWLAVPPVFFVAGWLGANNAEYDYATQRLREANMWDGPLTMMTDPSTVIFAFVLGFVLVTGDLYVRDLSSGAAAMTLLRSCSRTGWWAAKLCAVAPLALIFSLLAFSSALAASAVQLPLSLNWSPASRISWNSSDSAMYPNYETLPPLAFFLLTMLYTALVLWSIGAVVLGVSTLHPRMVTPLIAGFVWAMVGSPLIAPLAFREGLGTLDPAYNLSYVVHFGTDRGLTATPWFVSFLVVGGTLTLVLVAGSLWFRRVDL